MVQAITKRVVILAHKDSTSSPMDSYCAIALQDSFRAQFAQK